MELLVVLGILGFLAAIATPSVFKYLDSAKLSTARTEVVNLSASLDLFKFDVGRYPTTAEGLQALLAPPETITGWNGPYLTRTTSLLDPWRRPYNYRSPGQHGAFDLFSYGAQESVSGGNPAVANW
jgi:general secretion pathway protein G